MRRKLFTLAAGLSAVLCVGLCVLWVRSYWVVDNVFWSQPKYYWQISANRGAIRFYREQVPADNVWVSGPYAWDYRTRGSSADDVTAPSWRFAGFRYRRGEFKGLGTLLARWWWIYLPLWFVEVLLLILPIRWYTRLRRQRRRIRASHCTACGYDLRATPERCPECGAVPIVVGRSTPFSSRA